MTVTNEVIKDLLRLYQDGEASPDTRRMVEQFLAERPELREQAAAASAIRRPAAEIRLEIDDALRTLERTKAALARQKWLQFFAILFTLIPFSFAFSGNRVTFWMLRDAPLSLIPLWGAAAVLWIYYARSRRVA